MVQSCVMGALPVASRTILKPLPQTSAHGIPLASRINAHADTQMPTTACKSRQKRFAPCPMRGHRTPPRPFALRGHHR